jgi:hypothetical protein
MIFAEDGNRLWLRAADNTNAKVIANKKSPTIDITVKRITVIQLSIIKNNRLKV